MKAAKTKAKKKTWPAYETVAKPLEWFKPFKNNPKEHPPAQIKLLRDLMDEFGWTIPILADEHGEVIAGHGRLLAGWAQEYAEAPTIIARGWTTAQKQAYRIADNKLAEMATWNKESLKAEFGDLVDAGYDLDLTGFSADELTTFGIGADLDLDPPATSTISLKDKFGVVPFTVLNAREGWWQDRKRAWLALGIQSELGRGEEDGANATPGGSALPAADYSNRQRGDGRGRAIGKTQRGANAVKKG